MWGRGYRYRIGHGLAGKPDMVFVSARVVVFLDGCFWHGCPLHRSIPQSNVDFWERKLGGNAARDRDVEAKLRGQGWEVLRFWEHEVEEDPATVVNRIAKVLETRSSRGINH
jgi:DNA mismatch endonuclease (patch repair protein)